MTATGTGTAVVAGVLTVGGEVMVAGVGGTGGEEGDGMAEEAVGGRGRDTTVPAEWLVGCRPGVGVRAEGWRFGLDRECRDTRRSISSRARARDRMWFRDGSGA